MERVGIKEVECTVGWGYTSVIAYIGGKALLGRTFSHHKKFRGYSFEEFK